MPTGKDEIWNERKCRDECGKCVGGMKDENAY